MQASISARLIEPVNVPRWHIVEVFGVLQIVGGAELFVFGQSEEADILVIRRLVVPAQFG